MEEKKDYQDAYEKEHYKAVYLANRVAELEDQVDDLQFKIEPHQKQSDLESVRPCQKVHAFCDPPEGPFEKLRQPVGRDCKGAL